MYCRNATMQEEDRRAILIPFSGMKTYALDRREPAASLRDWVDLIWIVRWQLGPGEAFAQETLPHPSVNVVLGTHRPGVHGVVTKRFVARLTGSGWAVGARFAPGVFYPFLGRDLATIADRELTLADVFGARGAALVRHADEAPMEERPALLEDFLAARAANLDDAMVAARDAVRLAQSDPSIARADVLAKRAAMSVRTLERLFRKHVGASPKVVIRRFRIQEACLHASSGTGVAWTALAQQLGYFDQAHFIRDFKSQVGRTPLEYAKLCERASTS